MGPNPWPYRSRDLDGAWRAIVDLRDRVDEMQVAEEVKRAVTEALEEQRVVAFSRRQKIIAAVVAAVLAIVPNLHDFVHWASR